MDVAIERVQLTFSLNNIIGISVENNILYIAVAASTIIRIDLDNPGLIQDIQLPKRNEAIARIWADPTGSHLIITTTSNQFYYLHRETSQCRAISRLSGTKPLCLGWTKQGTVLVGSDDGAIYETDLEGLSKPDKYFKKEPKVHKVWSSPSSLPISGISIVNDLIVILSGVEVFFAKVEDGQTKAGLASASKVLNFANFLGITASQPSILQHSATHFAVINPEGVVLSSLEKPDQPHILSVKGATFGVLSRYHVLICVNDNLETYNVVNNSLVSKVSLGCSINGMAVDPKFQTYWMFNSDTLLEVKLEDEVGGMWRIYLMQNEFEKALHLAPHADKQIIYQAYGDHAFEQKEYEMSAKYYGLSNAHIEGIALKFIRLDEKQALLELFSSRFRVTKSPIQQVILSTWIVELLFQVGKTDELQSFVEKNLSKLDRNSITSILKTHGNDDLLIWFAKKTGDIAFVVGFWIEKSNWSKALEELRRGEDEDLIYHYSTVLLLHSPHETVESWMRIHKLDPLKLLPALLSYSSNYKGEYHNNQAIRYLRHQLTQAQGSVPAPLYNALLMIYAQSNSEKDLLKFLKDKAQAFPDYNFSLRICLEHDKPRSAIYLYSLMGLYEEAINLCLEKGFVDEAIEIADTKVDNEQTRRALWLDIARKIVATSGTKKALELVGHLNVEDLLEIFPDFDTLDSLAPEVVKALEASNNKLVSIHKEMQDSLNASEEMQSEIKSFKKRYALVEPGEPCQLCLFPLATRRFYVFPCQHGFHMDCIVSKLKQNPSQLSKIEALQKQVNDPQELNEALAPLVSAECLLCSASRIDTIDVPVEEVW